MRVVHVASVCVMNEGLNVGAPAELKFMSSLRVDE